MSKRPSDGLSKVLVANRGEIAVRIIRACKDSGIASVAVYAEPDRDALFVRLADEAHSLEGSTPGDSYLSIEKIIAIATKTGADSIHPGYGFLAENADFAQAVIDAGLIWIGPPPAAIENLGDKAKAKHIAQKADAPLAPGTKDPVKDADEIVAFAKEHGLPVAIKAVFGGGGRGLKVARTLRGDPRRCSSRPSARPSVAFGRGECLVEKFLDKPRHVETQCLADTHGNVVVISTRDCSLQRRHQKLVEEAPAPFLTDEQVKTLYDSSKAILKEAGYVGAGTCEFLVARRRHHQLPRGQHPPAGRAPGLRGGHRHRPRARDVPHRRRRGARLRRPRDRRPLDRVPHQRRGRRPRLPAGARHADQVGTPVRARRPCRRRLRGGRDHPGRLRLPRRQAHRHRHARREQALERSRRALDEFVVDGMPTVIPFHRSVVDDPAYTAADGEFGVYTTWIETDYDNQLEPYVGSGEDPDEPAERERVVVEVGGKRVEVVLPGGLGATAAVAGAKKPKRKSGGGPARRERRLAHLADAGHRREDRRRGRSGSRGGRPGRRHRGDEDGAADQRPQGGHHQQARRRGRRDRRRRRRRRRDHLSCATAQRRGT